MGAQRGAKTGWDDRLRGRAQSRPETPQEAGKAYQAGKGAKPHPGAAQTAYSAIWGAVAFAGL